MIVKANGMTYSTEDEHSSLHLSITHATNGLAPEILIAYVTCVDDTTQQIKRYFGVFDWGDEAGSIERIMQKGGKWPAICRNTEM